MLTCDSFKPSSRLTARLDAANASLISNRSISESSSSERLINFLIASIGETPIIAGSIPTSVLSTSSARYGIPCFSA